MTTSEIRPSRSLTAAGLRGQVNAWRAAEPAATGDLRRIAGRSPRTGGNRTALLDRLPRKPQRNERESAAAGDHPGDGAGVAHAVPARPRR